MSPPRSFLEGDFSWSLEPITDQAAELKPGVQPSSTAGNQLRVAEEAQVRMA
jgi:hypothetical protein